MLQASEPFKRGAVFGLTFGVVIAAVIPSILVGSRPGSHALMTIDLLALSFLEGFGLTNNWLAWFGLHALLWAGIGAVTGLLVGVGLGFVRRSST